MIIATGVRSPSHAESEYDGDEYADLPVNYAVLHCAPSISNPQLLLIPISE